MTEATVSKFSMASPADSEHQAMLLPSPPPTLPTRATTVEYKKDGTVSRMRSHRGNVPQLPQTKLCPYCPAKFTRTTHLNRHLRNHTNERMYQCEVCGAQFTRSDLLARHKRSCGESHPISRSRKRSCQACTSLKVKCDLRQPCSKCRARGRDCIYITEDGQREGAADSSTLEQGPNSRFLGPVVSLDASAGFDPSSLGRGGSGAFATAFPELTLIEEASNAISQPLNEANLASFMAAVPQVHHGAMSLPTIDADSDITASSFRLGRLDHAFISEAAGHSRGLQGYSSMMFEPFFRDVFAIKEETPQQNEQNAAPLLDAYGAGTLVDGFGPSGFGQTPSNGLQSFGVNLDSSLVSDLMDINYTNTQVPQLMPEPSPIPIATSSGLPAPSSGEVPTSQPMFTSNVEYDQSKPPCYSQDDLERPPPLSRPVDDDLPEPSREELEQYLSVFLTAFLPQIPVIHTQTLRLDLKPPMIVRAMQACGAIFFKTPVAQAFVEKTLRTCRDFLVHEFAKPSRDPKHQLHVIVTLMLLQMIGLFHQDPQQRASSNIYHGMLVLMVRQYHLIERNAAWEHQTFPTSDPTVLDETWHNWAIHESVKRVVCAVYCLDQAHRLYFSLPPSFLAEEFVTFFLPCDDQLWLAKDALEWSQLLLSPSPYGNIEERLRGVPMHRAFAAAGLGGPNMTVSSTVSPEPPDELHAVSPFGHFILLHAILGELFRRCSGGDSPTASPNPGGEEQVNEHVYAMQLALHRWLQMWLKTSAVFTNGVSQGETDTGVRSTGHFMVDPLPFYWLAQLLLLAFQEGLPPFHSREPTSSSASPVASHATESPNVPDIQVLHDPSPFAPPAATAGSSPFSPSPFAPSPFSGSSLSSGSSPVMPSTPPSSGLPHQQQQQEHTAGRCPRALEAESGPPKPNAAQFRLIKQWLHYIRLFLRRSQGSPTVVWDELMKIRLCGWQGDDASSSGQQSGKQHQPGEAFKKGGVADEEDSESWLSGDGLIGFFEEKLRI